MSTVNEISPSIRKKVMELARECRAVLGETPIESAMRERREHAQGQLEDNIRELTHRFNEENACHYVMWDKRRLPQGNAAREARA